MSHLSLEERQRLINSIPEAAVFDDHKENIMPRSQGRSAAALNGFLELGASEKEQELKRGHLKFKEKLESINDLDDPLSVYVEYVDWILLHYPLGHTRNSNLLPTLKLATESFVTDTRYKQCPRYLKLCLEYAKWVEDPATIYRFLMGHDIGQNLALFYEVYAGYLERKTKYEDAQAVFERGINNNAIPKDRLERNYAKMMDRIKERGPIITRPQHIEQMEELKSVGRTMLGVKHSSGSRYSQPSNVYNSTNNGATPTQQSTSTSIGSDFSNTPSSSSTARPKSTFRVYKESSSSSSVLPTGGGKPSRQLNVRSSLSHSENRFKAASYAGVTIKQAPFTPPPTQKFTVFKDNDSPSNTAPSSPNTLERGLSYASDINEPTTSIRKQPLSSDIISTKKTKKTKENPVSKANQERFNLYKDKYIKSSDSRGVPEIIACFDYPPALSFEEMRARRIKLPSGVSAFWEEETSTMVEEEVPHHSDGILESNEYSIRAPSPEAEPTQEITAETRFARDTMYSIFGSDSVPDEEDVTWTKKYQTFKPRIRKQVDENAPL